MPWYAYIFFGIYGVVTFGWLVVIPLEVRQLNKINSMTWKELEEFDKKSWTERWLGF